MLTPSWFHSMLSALPQFACKPALLFVSWRHRPIGPAKTSGGELWVSRTPAANLPSFDKSKSGKFPNACMPSGPFQIVCAELSLRLNSEIALPEPTYSTSTIRSGVCQKNELIDV